MKTNSIVVAGGCFWGVQKAFDNMPGVIKTEVGYAQSQVANPSYEMVCSQEFEVVEGCLINYDVSKTNVSDIMDVLFQIIDPFQDDGQGNDIGFQYHAGIFCNNKQDLDVAKSWLADWKLGVEQEVYFEIDMLKNFYPAETYHQNYLDKNPQGYCHINLSQIKYRKD